ncbi:MmpS family protein [Mycobacterium intracellulare]|uniref:MmpS family protein n=1 Tax=Mycobacterium intracellulare TaxID=1767 RepID=UPI0021E69128|nr:MmpS family protein [Mycobacterium intracellulare]
MVAVAAIVLGGIAVSELRGVFGSEAIFSATGSSAEPLPQSTVKHVTYEIVGARDARGSLSYLNAHAVPEQVSFEHLPWTYTISTTLPSVIANVVAQGDSDTLECRITVNGQLTAQQSSSGHHAQVSCLVKAA